MSETQASRNNTDGPKLTKWSKEPTVAILKQDLEAAKPSHDAHITNVTRWNDLLQVKGSAAPKKIQGRSSVQPKLIRRQAEWRYSALSEPFLSSKKLFKIEPVTFEDGLAARQNELLLNWQFRTKINRVKFIDDFVRSTVDEGSSVIRVGWKLATTTVKQMLPIFDHFPVQTEEQSEMLKQAIELKTANPREYEKNVPPEVKAAVEYYEETGEATITQKTGEVETPVEKIIENRPTVEVMNLGNVYIDPTCGGDLDRALFVVVSFETNKAELTKEGKKYRNLDKVMWENSTPLMETEHHTNSPNDFNFRDAARKKVVAYEYWGYYDIHGDGNLVPIVATWIGDVMIRMEENPYPDRKVPFVLVSYLPVKRTLYGEPDAELLEENQNILGAVTRGMIDLMGKSANAQTGTAKGMLDPLNKRRFDRGDDYEFNPINHPTQGIVEHKYPELPSSAITMVQMQNMDAEALSGVKSFAGGLSGEAYGDVAAGIRGALDASSKREMGILRRFAKGITEVGQKIISMNGEFMSEKEVIRVTNTQFEEILKEDLEGNFDLEVDISTNEVDNAKAQDMGFMLQTIGPNAGPEISMMIMAEIAELKRMPVLAEKLRTFKPTPDPMQEKLKELEMAKLEAEVAELQSQIELNKAKAQQALAMKDITDLDYVEQESGTKHARDMEKQAGQARGNMDLEVAKALTKPRKLANGGETKPNVEAAIGFRELTDKVAPEGPVNPGSLSGGQGPVPMQPALPMNGV